MRTAFILTTVCLLLTALTCVGLAIAQAPAGEEGQDKSVQRYLPDRRHPSPRPYQPNQPNRQRIIYAERIILQGPHATITLDARSEQPGIMLESRRTKERALVYINTDGKAIVGVTTPRRRELAAGLFTTAEHLGVTQLADRDGVHVFTGREIAGR